MIVKSSGKQRFPHILIGAIQLGVWFNWVMRRRTVNIRSRMTQLNQAETIQPLDNSKLLQPCFFILSLGSTIGLWPDISLQYQAIRRHRRLSLDKNLSVFKLTLYASPESSHSLQYERTDRKTKPHMLLNFHAAFSATYCGMNSFFPLSTANM